MTFGRIPPRPRRTAKEEQVAGPGDDVVMFMARLSPLLVLPGDPVDLSRRPGSAVVLMPGAHGRVTIDVDGAVVFFAPGAYAEQLTIKADCTVYHADLRQSQARPGAVLTIETGAVVLSGLRISAFAGPCMALGATAQVAVNSASLSQQAGADLVNITAGGLAVFVATILGPATSTATGAINNAGVIAAVDLTGVVKLVPGAHVNVTVVSEV